ncbi:unnamed protein product [Echinostoma caproni]|uniref:DDE_Tnp_IS1595 domain-containing protein n=1 Tax=Echinostoma caproni TaxID=27848 RepID=A0A183B5G7_9TREM|nr:unnamed protein product [Echinostoma caproni]
MPAGGVDKIFLLEVAVVLVSTMCRLSQESVIERYVFCREIRYPKLLSLNQRLGVPSKIVDFDETVMNKCKYGRGRPSETVWVSGMYDRFEAKGYFGKVDNRSASSLLPIIQRWIMPRSMSYSDEWAAYITLSSLRNTQLTVNHSRGFINQATQNIVEG